MEEKQKKQKKLEKLEKINNDIYVEINVIIRIYDDKKSSYLFNIGVFVVVVFVASVVVVVVLQGLSLRLN